MKSRRWVTCSATGKKRWPTKAEAKDARVTTRSPGHLHVYSCTACDGWHLGGSYGLSREDHRRIHSGDESLPEWLTVEEVTRVLKPRNPAKMRAVLERMAREGLVEAEGALGVTLIRASEVARLKRAAHDMSQDERLKEIGK